MAILPYTQPNAVTPLDTFNDGRNNALLGRSITAAPQDRNGLIGQVAMTDPKQALAFQGALQTQDDSNEDRRNKTLVNMSKLLVSAPDAYKDQIYQRIRPSLASLGLTQAPPNYNDEIGQTAKSIVDAYTPLNQLPVGLRETQGDVAAAGLTGEDAKKAYRIKLGVDARAVTGAPRMVMVKGSDGRDHPAIFDPSTGQVSSYNDDGWSSTGPGRLGTGAPPAPSAPPQLAGPIKVDTASEANALLKQGVPPNEAAARVTAKYREQLGAAVPSIVLQDDGTFRNGTQGDKFPPGEGPQTGSVTPPATGSLGTSNNSTNNLLSRTPEADAGAVQNAKNAADIASLPTKLKIEGDAAVDTAGRKAAAEAKAAADAKAQADFTQHKKDADDTLSLLEEAERILPNATGSKAGQMIDDVAAVGGKSTVGARATAQLQAIAGQITSKMPRMQGPQSDNDVRLYQQMAGDLANPDRPVETRMAALQVIRRLQNKYQAQQPAAGSATSGPAPKAGHTEDGYRFNGGDPADQRNWEKI
jgi:hypothetical protein